MNLTAQIAKQFRDVHFDENWTESNLKENLADSENMNRENNQAIPNNLRVIRLDNK
jgi:hypothetical protein